VTDELNKPIDESPEVPGASGEGEPAAEAPEEVVSPSPSEETPAPAEQAVEAATESAPAEEPTTDEPVTETANGDETAAEPETAKLAETVEPAQEAARAEASEPAEPEEEEKSENMEWYILKVQSNREDSIREGLQRRVKIAGLDRYFGNVIVPIEKVTEVKAGRKRVMKRKLYPGYLVVQMEINDDTWFLVRETPGIGDFTGAAGRPTPMLPHEVARIVSTQEEKADTAPKLKIAFKLGDRVKINEGTFENFEGEVETIDEASGRVTVMINIFGRSTPVELEYWQVETL
jgi:transcriptional antiterminator NusG